MEISLADREKTLTNDNNGDTIKSKWDNGLPPRGQVQERIEEDNLCSWVANELKIPETEATEYVEAVVAFTDAGSDIYSEIRRYQRGDVLQFMPETEVKRLSDDIETYIQKAPRWNGGVTHRGVSVTDEELAKYVNGFELNMGGTASWSGTQNVAKSFSERSTTKARPNSVIYHCDTQSKGTGIRHLSVYENEDEILCSKECKYIVDHVELDTEYIHHVYVKEV